MKDQNQVEFATVTKFFANKGYGFAATETEEPIYLDMAGYRFITAGEVEPEFSVPKNDRYPHIGDKLVFIRDRRWPGPGRAWHAFTWGYAIFWDLAVAQIEERQTPSDGEKDLEKVIDGAIEKGKVVPTENPFCGCEEKTATNSAPVNDHKVSDQIKETNRAETVPTVTVPSSMSPFVTFTPRFVPSDDGISVNEEEACRIVAEAGSRNRRADKEAYYRRQANRVA